MDEFPRLRVGLQVMPVTHEGREYVVLIDPAGYADHPVCVPLSIVFLLQLLDGNHSLRDIQYELMRKFGQFMPLSEVERFIHDLDACYLLDSRRFESLVSELEAAYRRRPLRMPVHAGTAYPDEPDRLRAVLDDMLAAGRPPAIANGKPLRALVVPHIDYARGHECYGRAYNLLRDHCDAERIIVLGTNHNGRSRSFVATRKSFQTPLGTVETDVEFLDEINRRYEDDLFEYELDHQREHSIELQAVWLKHVLGDRPFKIAPILCSCVDLIGVLGGAPADDETLVSFLRAINGAQQALPVNTCCIAGVDLSHVGPHFGDAQPLSDAGLRDIERQDLLSLECVARMDVPGFYDSVMGDGNARRVCGLSPIYTMMHIADVESLALLQYKQCVDRDNGCAVSCAAMAGFAR